MKKKLFRSVSIFAIAIMAGVNVFKAHQPVQLSDIAMANVEALATGEIVPGYTGPTEVFTCYKEGVAHGNGILCKTENNISCSIILCE